MRAVLVTLIVVAALSFVGAILSVNHEPRPDRIDRRWNLDPRDNQSWSEAEVDAIMQAQQYQRMAIHAKQELAQREAEIERLKLERAITQPTDAEQLAAWRLLWKNK